MQVVEGDRLHLEPAKAFLESRAKGFGVAFARMQAPFGCDDEALREWRERSPDRPLALTSRVRVGGVEVGQACGHGRSKERDTFGCVSQPIRTEPDS